MQQIKILGSKVDILSRQEIINKIVSFLKTNEAHAIVTANAEMYYQAYKDQELQEAINQADLAIPDSVGIILALWRYGIFNADLLPGIDLCAWFLHNKIPTYILGAKPEVLEKINLPAVVGKHHGYFKANEEQKIIIDIQQKKPKVLLVALGAGKQEKWIAKYRKILNIPIMIGIGGSIDIISGSKPRAPKIMRQLKLEWLYRLYKEPARITRQVNLLFFLIAVILKRKSV